MLRYKVFLHTRRNMDIIYECAAKFFTLQDFEYTFVVSKSRKSLELKLNFMESDFFHLAGLQYLTDISIPKNRKNTLHSILEKKNITDALLQKSRHFVQPKPDKDVKSRIEELRFLEQYLDTDNSIRIFTTRNSPHLSSQIDADYIIESQFKHSTDTVYIFLKERKEDPTHLCAVSFFKKGNLTFGGDSLYWLLKEKNSLQDGSSFTLFQHKDYKK